jgi:ribosomal protein L18
MSDQSMGYGEEVPVIKETRPSKGGLTLGGNKGVSLEPESSMEIRNRLLEMIRQREGERSGFDALMERLAVSGQAPGTSFQSRLDAYNKNQQARNQDIFNMQLGISQLDTEQQRLAQARAEALQGQQNFDRSIGLGGQGEGGVSEAKMAQTFNALSPEQQMTLRNMYKQNPLEAQKQLLLLTKQTDLQRNLRSAGIQEGSPEWNNAILAGTIPSAGEFVDVPDPLHPGFLKQVPKSEARRTDIGIAQGPLSNTPAPAASAPAAPAPAAPAPAAPAPAAPEPVRDGALPTSTAAPVRRDGALPATAPAQVTTVGGKTLTSPRAISKINTANPYPKTDKRYGAFEENKAKAALELEVEDQKANISLRKSKGEADIDVDKQGKLVPIEGQKTEAQKMAETHAKEQTELSDSVKRNTENDIYAKRIISNVDSIPKEIQQDVFNTLNQAKFKSAILNFIDQGINTPLGSLSIPGFKDVNIQLSPKIRKQTREDGTNPVLDSAQQVKADTARLTLAFTQAANKGQGAVSDSERRIYMQAVADPNRSTGDMIKLMALSVQLAASHSAQTQGAWENAQKAGLLWPEFKRSDQYKTMIANQIKESEEKLIPNRRR